MPSSQAHGLDVSTGAASGFGAAIAARFAEEGCAVLLTDINKDGLRAQATQMLDSNARVAWYRLDVTDADDWRRAVGHCLDVWHRLDICVNNAGTTYKNRVSRRMHSVTHELNTIGYTRGHGGGV
jgi:NADP-dependent 3-hydroxy acid dehydrogenase YdfG